MKTRGHGNVKTLATLAACVFAYLNASTFAHSAEVSSAEASEAVAGWTVLQESLGEQFTASASGVSTYEGADGRGRFHVVSFEGGGFVVTSGDTEVTPILAYSEDGEFVASDENPLWVMLTQDVAGRTKRLEDGAVSSAISTRGAKAGSAATSANASAWARLRNAAATPAKPLLRATLPKAKSVVDLRVGPLCAARWNQGDAKGGRCYNYYTPSNVVCGCVATALAQIMKRFEWPRSQVELGGNEYSGTFTEILDVSSTVSVTNVIPWNVGGAYGDTWMFGGPAFGGVYDWANMPDIPSEESQLSDVQRRAIGHLCRDCGIATRMGYKKGGSASYTVLMKLCLVGQFGYANAVVVNKSDVETLLRAMVASFDLGSPCGVGISKHSIVGDGYGYSDGRLYIHFNWGWGVHGNTAWYTPALTDEETTDYPTIKYMVYDIYTPEMCAEAGRTVVSGRVTGEDGEPFILFHKR